MPILLADEELDTLTNLQHRDGMTYLQLRRRMDYSTGIVGRTRKVSYQMLIEYTEVPSKQGRLGEHSTYKEMRGVVNRLCQARLLVPLHVSKGETLVFKMPMAPYAVKEAKKSGHTSGRLGEGEDGQAVQSESKPPKPKRLKGLAPSDDVEKPPKKGEVGPSFSTASKAEVGPSIRFSGKPKNINNLHGSVTLVEPNTHFVPKRLADVLEDLRAKGIHTQVRNPDVIEIAAHNDEIIEAALKLATENRRRYASDQPLNPGFVLSMCRTVITRELNAMCVSGQDKTVLQEKALSLGISPPRHAESARHYIERVRLAQERLHSKRIAALADELANWQRHG